MLLRCSSTTESAIDHVGWEYEKSGIDWKIRDYLKAPSPEHTIQEIASFIMSTKIGMFIVCICYYNISWKFSAPSQPLEVHGEGRWSIGFWGSQSSSWGTSQGSVGSMLRDLGNLCSRASVYVWYAVLLSEAGSCSMIDHGKTFSQIIGVSFL